MQTNKKKQRKKKKGQKKKHLDGNLKINII